MKLRVYYHKISYEQKDIEAVDMLDAKVQANEFLSVLKDDYYNGGDWVIESIEPQ